MAALLIAEADINTSEAVCEYLYPQDAGHTTIPVFGGDEAITLFPKTGLIMLYWILCCPPLWGWLSKSPSARQARFRYLRLQLWRMNKPRLPALTASLTKPFSMVILGK